MQPRELPRPVPTSPYLSVGGAWPSLAAIALLAFLASCDGCTERTPDVCCTSDTECAQLGLPPGSASDYGCGPGQVCRDFYCAPAESPDASAPVADAAIDAPSGRCNPDAPFGTPTRVPNINSALEELEMILTGDELTAFFVRHNGISYVLQTSSRNSISDNFVTPTVGTSIAALGSTYSVSRMSITPDGLILYFRVMTGEVYAAYRPDTSAAFVSASRVSANGSPLYAHIPKISGDAMTLYWSMAGDEALHAASRAGTIDAFVDQRVASIPNLTDFIISADELTLYYSNFPYPDIFVSTRTSKNVAFDVGVPLANVNTSSADIPLGVTTDGCLLYIRSNRPGSDGANDFWVAQRSF